MRLPKQPILNPPTPPVEPVVFRTWDDLSPEIQSWAAKLEAEISQHNSDPDDVAIRVLAAVCEYLSGDWDGGYGNDFDQA